MFPGFCRSVISAALTIFLGDLISVALYSQRMKYTFCFSVCCACLQCFVGSLSLSKRFESIIVSGFSHPRLVCLCLDYSLASFFLMETTLLWFYAILLPDIFSLNSTMATPFVDMLSASVPSSTLTGRREAVAQRQKMRLIRVQATGTCK